VTFINDLRLIHIEARKMADDLRPRESVRREALWAMSHLMPGDLKAATILDVLDDIGNRERIDSNWSHPGLDIEAARKAIQIERCSSGISIVREAVFNSMA
jgi:hypothetical protein